MYGIGSAYVYELDETIRRLSWKVRGYVANLPCGQRPTDLEPLLDVADMPAEWLESPVVFPLVTPGHRAAIAAEAGGLGFTAFPILIDPTSVVALRSSVGEGTFVNAGSVIGARSSLGRFVSVNRSASVGHDAILADYASLGPGCVLCGGCTVDEGAFVGAGATLLPGVTVGRNAVVGAGSVVVADVPPHTLVVGNPARVVKDGIAGHNGVGVGERQASWT